MKYFKLLIICMSIGSYFNVNANNVQVSNLSVDQPNQKVTFTLGWENSWNLNTIPNNSDAVWVFVKYRLGGIWAHSLLNTSAGTHALGSSLAVASLTDAIGIMIKRSSFGNGTISSNNTVTLQLTNLPTTSLIELVQVFAIEMVQIPSGIFSLGDNSTSDSSFTNFSISGEALIVPNSLRPANGGLAGQSGTIPAAFPKGFDEFYIMKYEISAAQYTAFLNTLTRAQQINRVETDISVSGSITNTNVMWDSPSLNLTPRITSPTFLPNTTDPVLFTCACPDKACHAINYADVAAYLDWSGLRPMTELEYEKACRGATTRVSGEYAWGNALIFFNSSSINIVNINTASETLSDCDPANNPGNLGVASYSGKGIVSGALMVPLRCGFPGSAANNRSLMGATFYGAMEMSGNVTEYVVNVSNASGLTFTGVNGDGSISSTGNANASLWPSSTTCNGVGRRGGDFNALSGKLRISDRALINLATNTTLLNRTDGTGGRGCR